MAYNNYRREPAVPTFTQLLRGITESNKIGDDQFAPTFFKLPTGKEVNRVFVVGVLTECEDIGTDTEYLRGRMADPSGTISIYAGEFQPEAAQILAEIETPAFVAVVGKPSIYEADSGLVISIRPESVTIVDSVTRDLWIQAAAAETLAQLKDMKESDTKSAYTEMVTASLESI